MNSYSSQSKQRFELEKEAKHAKYTCEHTIARSRQETKCVHCELRVWVCKEEQQQQVVVDSRKKKKQCGKKTACGAYTAVQNADIVKKRDETKQCVSAHSRSWLISRLG